MPLQVWTKNSNYHLGTFNERNTLTLPLPAQPLPNTIVNYKIISGSLPKGLKLIGPTIIGTPFEVSRTTDYKFVIRATDGVNIADRTFLMTIEGSDEPNWLTQPGLLPVGPNDAYYIVDSSFIDFQLVATDTDTAAGQKLNFFIASQEGELPPGLVLMPNGRITGFIQPLLAVPKNEDQGFYDSGLYDSVSYDFGYRSTNGYDSFVYDLVTYGFSVNTLKPRKLNRNYEFIATITDGDSVTKRKFRIFVVGDDFFRSDNVIMQAGTGAYTADITYLRSPIFTTAKYLGLRRANNYQTFKIDIYEGDGNLGPVVYELSPVNARMNAVVRKDLSLDNRLGSTQLRIENATATPTVGQKLTFNLEFTGATPRIYTVQEVDVLGGTTYRLTLDQQLEVNIPSGQVVYLGDDSTLPSGMVFDPTTGEIFGNVPYLPAITETYNFTIKATRFGQGSESAVSRRVFTVDILGEVESVMNWITPSDLGTIDVGFPSTSFVAAESSFQNASILYSIQEGSLPPGLDLNLDGEIIGKVNQQRDQNTYRSYWQQVTNYKVKDIVKIDTIGQLKSVVRRRNTATVVTKKDHNFKTGDIVKINSSELEFNSYSGVEINVNNFKVNEVLSIEGTGPYRVKFSIPTQKIAPLAPVFTLIQGAAFSTSSATYNNIAVKSTTGSGLGARFRIVKGNNGVGNPATYVGVTTVTVIDPGEDYLPSDFVTISGALLGGVDGTHDLIFQLSTGLEFYYKINGNSNDSYNGRYLSVSSKPNEIILLYPDTKSDAFLYPPIFQDFTPTENRLFVNFLNTFDLGTISNWKNKVAWNIDGWDNINNYANRTFISYNEVREIWPDGIVGEEIIIKDSNLDPALNKYYKIKFDSWLEEISVEYKATLINQDFSYFLNVFNLGTISNWKNKVAWNIDGWDNINNYDLRDFITYNEVEEIWSDPDEIIGKEIIIKDSNKYYKIKFDNWEENNGVYVEVQYDAVLIVDDPSISVGRIGSKEVKLLSVENIKIGDEVLGIGIQNDSYVVSIDTVGKIIELDQSLVSKAVREYKFKPGIFGTGLVSTTIGPGSFEAQTQLIPTNYFNYPNSNSSLAMKSAEGTLLGTPLFYIATKDHISDLAFTDVNWKEYLFPESDKSITVIDQNNTFLDGDDTSVDKVYTFTIKARDQIGYSSVVRTFNLRINIPNNTYYSNITAKPFMKQNQRTAWKDFVNNGDIFDPRYIYRLGDPNFGIQRSLTTLVYAGIETREAVEYISAMGLNHKPKRFKLGQVKKAVAKEPGTNTVLYEVIYIDLIDPLEKGKSYLPFKVIHTPSSLNVTIDNNNEFYSGPNFSVDTSFWDRPIPFNSTTDRTDVFAGDSGTGVKFPSSISIWRKRLRGILTAGRERNYLPLWMRSIQENSYTELDWVPAVPLCFCKPGGADEIILNIKNNGFDFKLLDYTIDRYIIDSVEGHYEDKYLVFRNDRTTIA